MGFEMGTGSGTAGTAYKTWSLTHHGELKVDALAGRGTLGRVLEAIRSEGSASAADIVRSTGLPIQTVKATLEIAKAKGYAATIN